MKKIFFIFIILLWAVPCWSTTYYVDTTCTDTNVGSATVDGTTYDPTTPACTGGSDSYYVTVADINAAAATLIPGDTVSFRKGQTWREQLTVPESGTSGNVYTFTAHGTGNDPIITAFDLITDTWTEDSGEYYVSETTEPKGILKDGTNLDKGTIGSLPEGEWGYNTVTDRIYYHPVGAGSPSGTFEKMLRDYAVKIDNKDYITVDGLELQGQNESTGGASYDGVIAVWDASNITITNCTVKFAYRMGIALVDTTDSTVSNNTVYRIAARGIEIYGDDGPAPSTITVSGNTIYETGVNWSGISPDSDQEGISVNGLAAALPTGITITQNSSYSNGRDDMTAAKGRGINVISSSNVTISRNLVYDNASTGITFGEGNSDDISVDCYNNLIYNNGKRCAATSEAAAGLKCGPAEAGTLNIYQNTIVDNDSCSSDTWENAAFYITASATDGGTINFKNNIIANNDGDWEVSTVWVDGHSVTFNTDYNDIYRASGNMIRHRDTTGGGGTSSYDYSQFSNYQTDLSPFDANSINSDPLFIDAENNDFKLNPDSPCINAGTDVSISYDYRQRYRPQDGGIDIGVFEGDKRKVPPGIHPSPGVVYFP